jgi:hypothetical protein
MKTIYTFLLCCIANIGFAQIDRAEYFIDTDPGIDNGTPITINTPGFNVSESFSVDTSSLSNGIHTLYVRTKEANDVWSLYYKQTFLVHDFSNSSTPSQIIAAEYFIDTDPGTNAGTAFAITPGFSVSESLAISTAALSDGIHTLYVRTKDDDNRWSLYFKQTFLVHTFASPAQTQINKVEYFFDTDPGVNLGQEIAITPEFNLNEAVAIPSGSLALGTHYLYIRARDENGVWSLYEVIEFEVTENLGVDENIMLLVKIYPNPASDIITIDTKTEIIESIKIFDISGKLINDYGNSYSSSEKLDISNYAKGTYFLKVKTESGLTTKKIVVN